MERLGWIKYRHEINARNLDKLVNPYFRLSKISNTCIGNRFYNKVKKFKKKSSSESPSDEKSIFKDLTYKCTGYINKKIAKIIYNFIRYNNLEKNCFHEKYNSISKNQSKYTF